MRGLLGPPRRLDLLALGSVWLAGAVEAVGCRRARRAAALVLAASKQPTPSSAEQGPAYSRQASSSAQSQQQRTYSEVAAGQTGTSQQRASTTLELSACASGLSWPCCCTPSRCRAVLGVERCCSVMAVGLVAWACSNWVGFLGLPAVITAADWRHAGCALARPPPGMLPCDLCAAVAAFSLLGPARPCCAGPASAGASCPTPLAPPPLQSNIPLMHSQAPSLTERPPPTWFSSCGQQSHDRFEAHIYLACASAPMFEAAGIAAGVDVVGYAKHRRPFGDDAEQQGLGRLCAAASCRDKWQQYADHAFSQQPEQPSVNGTFTYQAASNVPVEGIAGESVGYCRRSGPRFG